MFGFVTPPEPEESAFPAACGVLKKEGRRLPRCLRRGSSIGHKKIWIEYHMSNQLVISIVTISVDPIPAEGGTPEAGFDFLLPGR